MSRTTFRVTFVSLALIAAACGGDDPTTNPETEPEAGFETHSLAIDFSGTGRGVVASVDGDLACDEACLQDLPAGTRIRLSASSEPGSAFRGWSGDCSGMDDCIVLLDADRQVGAKYIAGRAMAGHVHESDATQNQVALAYAADGSYVVASALKGSVQIGPSFLSSSATQSLVLVRYRADGEILWARVYGTGGEIHARDVLIDGDSIFVTGLYNASTTLDAAVLPAPIGGHDGFIASFHTSAGQSLWSQGFGSGSFDSGRALARSTEHVVAVADVAGKLSVVKANPATGVLDLGPIPLTMGSAIMPRDAVVTSDGGLVVVGEVKGSVVFDGVTSEVGGPAAEEAFIVRYALDDLGHEWTRIWTSTLISGARAILETPGGDLVVAGTFVGFTDLGEGVVESNHYRGAVTVLGGDGAIRWAREYVATSDLQLDSSAVGADGDLYVGGQFNGSAIFADEAADAKTSTDGLLLRLDPSTGEPVWFTALAGAGAPYVTGLAASEDHVVLAGTTTGRLDLDGIVIGAGVASDVFVAHFGR